MPKDGRRDPKERRDTQRVPRVMEVEASPGELLSALARLDFEAALAYEVAAELSPADDVRRELVAFAQDHRRHAGELNRLLEQEGEAAIPEPADDSAVLSGLMRLAGPIGSDVLVVALLVDEQLANLSYDAALAYEWQDEAARTIERFGADEQRHLAWLARRHEEIAGPERGPEPPGAG